jgi:hypothetical protein
LEAVSTRQFESPLLYHNQPYHNQPYHLIDFLIPCSSFCVLPYSEDEAVFLEASMPEPKQFTLKLDAGTLVLIISVLILLPLLFTGFLAH